jgi:O-antigen ligase
MNNSFNNLFKEKKNKIDLILIILIALLPSSLLFPSAILNLIGVTTCIFFAIKIIVKKELSFFKNNFFYILFFFWCSLIINLFFTSNINESFPRALVFGRFIILTFAVKYYLNFKNNKYQEFIYRTWFWIFIIVTFDLIFETIFGFNTLGFKSPWHERLSGFLNKELKIGHYYYSFAFLALSYLFCNIKTLEFKKSFLLFIFLLFLTTSFLIGERSNFIRMLFMSVIFVFLFDYKNFVKKTILIIFILITIFLIILYMPKFKTRYWDQIIDPIKSNGIIEYIKKTQYGAHFDTSINIFKQKPIFGVGLKNFRNEAGKEMYKNDLNFNSLRWSTHPHQLHFEFLSETGIFGYLAFLVFIIYSVIASINIYLEKKNIYHLSSILCVIVSVLPLIPSGSFFTSYGATIFWINYGVMISYKKILKKS